MQKKENKLYLLGAKKERKDTWMKQWTTDMKTRSSLHIFRVKKMMAQAYFLTDNQSIYVGRGLFLEHGVFKALPILNPWI